MLMAASELKHMQEERIATVAQPVIKVVSEPIGSIMDKRMVRPKGKKSHTEYLVRYSDGTEKWERSNNVSDDLIHVYNGIKVTNKGKPIAELVPTEEESFHHVVKKIIGHRRNVNQSFSYLVKWASKDIEDSWVVEDK